MTKRIEFVNWLHKQLQARRWKQTDLARAAGIDSGTMSRIMSGERGVGPDTCIGLTCKFDRLISC